ncbi:hypothetical protein OEG84_03835 [Hoeflea sp. G2-23]|uniref:Ricin B lectin domain-containing protein n=1 Tax=Hoeflea algicola TaxID=2983763 RepID=A0ABT3Z5D7_9HYPH|nr:hypothetical protein [Hoeflea algicola]MCY0146868.1 hypothetical protein [Hoeflea algicola]
MDSFRNSKRLALVTWLLVFVLALPVDLASAQQSAVQRAVKYVKEASVECASAKILFSRQKYKKFQSCMNGYALSPDPLPVSSPFKIRHKTGLYLRSSSGSSVRLMPQGEGDTWLWEDGERIINLRNGMVLQANTNGKTVSLALPDDPLGDRALWSSTVSNFAYRQAVALQSKAGSKSLRLKSGSSVHLVANAGSGAKSWRLMKAPPADLARITLKSIRALVTSTGQDENTKIALMSIELAFDLATMAGSGGGAGIGLKAGVTAAKAAGKKGVQALSKKIGKEIAEIAANRALKKTVGGLQKLAAKKAMKKMIKKHVALAASKKTKQKMLGRMGKYVSGKIAGAGGKAGLKKTAKEMAAEYAIKQAWQNSYNEAFKATHDGRSQSQYTSDFNEAEQVAEIERLKQESFERFYQAAAAPLRFAAVENVEEVVKKVMDSEGRKGNEGLIQGMLSPFIDDTRDELYIQLDGVRVYGGSRGIDIDKGDVHKIGKSLIFDRIKGVTIRLKEWDDHSSDDELGHLDINTTTLAGKEEYKGVLIYSTSEGSLYQLNFSVEPFAGIYEAGILADHEYGLRFIREVNSGISNQIRLQGEALEARRSAEVLRRQKETRDTMAQEGADGFRRYEAIAAWRKKAEAQCDYWDKSFKYAKDDTKRVGGIPTYYGRLARRMGIPGTWRAGKLTRFLERDDAETWRYTFLNSRRNGGYGSATGKGMDENGGRWSTTPRALFGPVRQSYSKDQLYQMYGKAQSCLGIFLVRKPGAGGRPVRRGFNDNAEQAETHLPVFQVKTGGLEAYAVNFLGEPVMWLRKIGAGPDYPDAYAQCEGSYDPDTKRHTNLTEDKLIGVWEGEATCRREELGPPPGVPPSGGPV